MRYKIFCILFFCINLVFGYDIDSQIQVLLERTKNTQILFSNLHTSEEQERKLLYENIKEELLLINNIYEIIVTNIENIETKTMHISYPLAQIIKQLLIELNTSIEDITNISTLYQFFYFSSEYQYLDILFDHLNSLRIIINFFPINDNNFWISTENQNMTFNNIEACIIICNEIQHLIADVYLKKQDVQDCYTNIANLIDIANNNSENMFFSIIINKLTELEKLISSNINQYNYISINNFVIKLTGIYCYIQLLNIY